MAICQECNEEFETEEFIALCSACTAMVKCPNCKRPNSKHSHIEFLYCTKKIMKDLILAEENRRRLKMK